MSFLKNSLFMLGQGGVVRIFGVFTTAVLSRLLGSADFGLYNLIVNTAATIYGFVRLGTDAAITVFSGNTHLNSEERDNKGTMLGAGMILLLISGLIGASICIFFSDYISNSIIKQKDITNWIKLVSVLVMIQCISQFLYSATVGFQRFPEYAKAMAFNSIIGLLLALFLGFNYGLIGAMLGLVGTQVLSLLKLFKIIKKTLFLYEIKIKFSDFTLQSKKILKFGFPFYLSGLAIIPSAYYGQLLLIQNSGIETIGGLRIISTLVTFVSFIPASISSVILQKLSSVSESKKKFIDTFFLLFKYSWIFSILIGILTTLITPIFIYLVFGPKYLLYAPATTIAIFSSVCSILISTISNAAFSTGRVMVIFKYTVVQAIFFIVTAIIIVPFLGIKGYFISEIIGQITIFIFLFSFKKVRSVLKDQSWILSCCYITVFYLAFIPIMMLSEGLFRIVVGSLFLLFICLLVYKYILHPQEKFKVMKFVDKTFLKYKTSKNE